MDNADDENVEGENADDGDGFNNALHCNGDDDDNDNGVTMLVIFAN